MDELDAFLASRARGAAGPELPRVVAPGTSLLVGSDGGILELRVTDVHDDGSFTARAARLEVRGGLRIDGRVHDGERAWRLAYVVERADAVNDHEAEVLVRLAEATPMNDERGAPRVAYETLGMARLRSLDGYDVPPGQVRTLDLSTSGVSFECEARYERGQTLDFTFEDENANPIVLRLEVVRSERGMFGRTRTMGRITAIPRESERLLEALVARRLLRAPARPEPADEPAPPEPPADERARGVRGWLRRSA
jgi:hypothetical protein